MTKEEYLKEKRQIEIDCGNKERELARRFVKENNPYDVGDIITDHIGSIKMESFKVAYSYSSIPDTVYFGLCLKKDGTPTKKMEKRELYGENIISK